MLVLALGWSRRWMNEDAYINLRVVDQVFAGNGPTFNAGERVEVATSPAWIAVLCIGRATLGLLIRMEWVAVLAALAAAVAAFTVAARAGRCLHPGNELVLPLGIILVAAVPVVWDFATSGLEMGAVWLWTAGCWLALVRACRRADAHTGRARTGALVVLGFGPGAAGPRGDVGVPAGRVVGDHATRPPPPPPGRRRRCHQRTADPRPVPEQRWNSARFTFLHVPRDPRDAPTC